MRISDYFPEVNKSTSAFTIIELISILSIIGILISIAVPSSLSWLYKSRESAYFNTLISYLEVVKNEVRRYGMSCSLSPRKTSGSDRRSFDIECYGISEDSKKIKGVLIPEIHDNIYQEVSNVINVTPKGQIALTKNDLGIVIVIGSKSHPNQKWHKPKCILINAPSGMINTGIYQKSYAYDEKRNQNIINSNLEASLCNRL